MQPHVISDEVVAVAVIVLACLGGAAVVILISAMARCAA